jgi:hypothetical protein
VDARDKRGHDDEERHRDSSSSAVAVMAGFMPAISLKGQCLTKRDHRDKPGDDGLR